MIKQSTMITGSVLVLFAFTAIGCGQGMKSNGAASTGSTAAAGTGAGTEEIAQQMKKAEKAAEEAQAAILEANEVLKSIQDDNGNININLFSGNNSGVNSSGLLAPVIDKLRGAFDQVFAKVALVKSKFNEARMTLAAAVAKLDKNDPAQARMAEQITKQLAQIDALEAKFRSSMSLIAGKLDLAVAALEKLLSGVTSFIPGFGWIVDFGVDYLLMGDVRDFIAEIKAKLLSI